MPTTQETLRGWIADAPEGTHWMIIGTDCFDYTDYPVYESDPEKCREKIKELQVEEMSKVMEVYDLQQDIEMQLEVYRAWYPPAS